MDVGDLCRQEDWTDVAGFALSERKWQVWGRVVLDMANCNLINYL